MFNKEHNARIGPEKRDYRQLENRQFPHSEKPGGLKGSMQHWLAVYLRESEIPTSFVAVD
jgi:hypothetical protein